MYIKRSVPHHIAILGLIVWVLFSTVLGRAFTAVSLGEDDAQLFAYIGEKWVAGYIPYVDIWDNKPPGIFWVVALVFSLAPRSFIALAVLEGIFIIGCATTIYAFMRRVGAPPIAMWLATVACAIMSNLTSFNEGGNLTEIYILWPAALSMLMFARALPDLHARRLMLAGVCTGIATSFKLVGLAPFLAQLVFLVLCYTLGHWNLRTLVSSVTISIFGFGLAWLPWLAYFSWHDSLLELLRVSFAHPFLYGATSQPSLYSVPFYLVDRLRPVASLAGSAFVSIGILVPYMYKILSAPLSVLDVEMPGKWVGGWAALSALWLLFDILGALAGGRAYPHYFLAISASLSVMAGIGYWYTVERMGSRTDAMRVFVLCAILSSALFAQALDFHKLRSAAQSTSFLSPIIEYLNNHKEQSTTLFSWGYRPQLYFETGLMSPHKLTSSLNLRDSPYLRQVFADDLLNTLERECPSFIVDEDTRHHHAMLMPVYQRFQALIDNKYEFVRAEGKVRLYKKRSSSTSED